MSASAVAFQTRPMRSRFRVDRKRLEGAMDGKLYFAQVREDPALEIAALEPHAGGTYIVVGSGGCTALSLLAEGAGRVVAVDMNATQNHVTELKAAAIAALDSTECVAFLGAAPMDASHRFRLYRTLRQSLSRESARYWDSHRRAIESGALNAGVSERFISVLSRIVTALIHPKERVERFLACDSIEKQAKLYHEEWNNRRWKLLFKMLLNRWTLKKTYDPAFFAHVKNESFAAHFHGVFERAVTMNPVRKNYFLHHMLTGRYPTGESEGLPPYLEPGSRLAADGVQGLEIVDGSFQDYLWLCETSSADGIVLSNICEWITEGEIERLFAAVARVAKPGATVCFRNFVGHTEVPAQFASVIREDRDAGDAAIMRDRSCVQARFAVCTVEKDA
jgi:S-adenosylmethionine-diacylglycerol 3-amino-3-carboxypropyl transferase